VVPRERGLYRRKAVQACLSSRRLLQNIIRIIRTRGLLPILRDEAGDFSTHFCAPCECGGGFCSDKSDREALVARLQTRLYGPVEALCRRIAPSPVRRENCSSALSIRTPRRQREKRMNIGDINAHLLRRMAFRPYMTGSAHEIVHFFVLPTQVVVKSSMDYDAERRFRYSLSSLKTSARR